MILIREIEYADFTRGVMNLINVFTREPREIMFEEFCKTIDLIKKQGATIFICEEDNVVMGMIKIIIEQKLHNNLRCVGHIEDVATLEQYRGKGIATMLIEKAIQLCKDNNCYKIVLTCNTNNILFYKNRGFIEKGVEMSIYL